MTPTCTKGQLTRSAILGEAMQMASIQGLEGISIGQLAEATCMSKAGLFAHFGSKEGLQLAVVQAARELFVQQALAPALQAPRGLPRLCALCHHWLEYAEREVFRGGCFFAGAATEFDGRPGAVRDLLASIFEAWQHTLVRLVIEARLSGELAEKADPELLAFEFQALMIGANNAFQLHRDASAFALARRALRERLKPLLAPGLSLAPL